MKTNETKTNEPKKEQTSPQPTDSLYLLIKNLLSEVKGLKDERHKLTEKLVEATNFDHSNDLDKLFEALAKAQNTMSVAQQDSTNPYFKSKYADLYSIIEASREALSSNGLCVSQVITQNDLGQTILHSILGHKSGQFISSKMTINPPKADIQSFGSCVTYLRRYTYASLCGVVASNEDDDGEKVMVETRAIKAKKADFEKPDMSTRSFETLTKEQLEEIEYELEGFEDIGENLLERWGLNSLADIPKAKFLPIIKRVREIKQAREGK